MYGFVGLVIIEYIIFNYYEMMGEWKEGKGRSTTDSNVSNVGCGLRVIKRSKDGGWVGGWVDCVVVCTVRSLINPYDIICMKLG